MTSLFQQRVREVVRNIPKGSVLSYKQVAEKAGFPRAFRAVGSEMRRNHNPEIPCHRVIKSNGQPGGYNGGEMEKELRLYSENAGIDTLGKIKYTIIRKNERLKE